MKKLLFFAALIMIASATFGQGKPAAKADNAVFEWVTTSHDFGKVPQNIPVTHEFKFTNKGKVPLIITNVQASCGCTTPGWSHEPVPPGGQGYVKATFNAANAGHFDKSVTVTANIESGFVSLAIRGDVEAKAQ